MLLVCAPPRRRRLEPEAIGSGRPFLTPPASDGLRFRPPPEHTKMPGVELDDIFTADDLVTLRNTPTKAKLVKNTRKGGVFYKLELVESSGK